MLATDSRDQGLALASWLKGRLPRLALHARGATITIDDRNCPQLLDLDSGELNWASDARQFAENRRWALNCNAGLRKGVADVVAGWKPRAHALLRDVRGLDVLDDHQWVAVGAMTLPGGYGLCLFDEQGTGKTVTLIHAFDVLVGRNEVDVLLVVAPKSMVPEWINDFGRFKGGLYHVVGLAGGAAEKRAALAGGGDVFVINYESAVGLLPELLAFARSLRRRPVLAVDESYNVKNLDTRRTQALRRLREPCGRAYVLCGTPAPNSAKDIVQQMSLVDFGLAFWGVTIPTDRVAASAVVQRAIDEKGVYIRNLKSAVLPDLPLKSFNTVMVRMEPIQERLYEAALSGLVRDLRKTNDISFHKAYTSFLARRTALMQICSHPAAVNSGYSEVPAKLVLLDRLLNEAIAQRNEKVVLWSAYRASIDALVERYARYGVVRYDGMVTAIADRRSAVRRFQESDEVKLFIGNPAAAGAGLTLHRARLAVYESLSAQAAHYLQSIDRIHRRGQQHEVQYFVLLCEHTIEVAEYERLVSKERAAQELLRDNVAPPTSRKMMLSEMEAAIRDLRGPWRPNDVEI